MPVKKPTAKRSRTARRNGACLCGSGKPAVYRIPGEDDRACSVCLRELQQELADHSHVSIDKLVAEYVIAPSRLSSIERQLLARAVATSSVAPRIRRLERISKSDPGWHVGDDVDLFLSSFSSVLFSREGSAGSIAWKSSDRAIVAIDSPTRGFTVDYEKVNQRFFSASGEQETIVTGAYRVIAVERIVEPHTYPQYGYRVPLYTLTER